MPNEPKLEHPTEANAKSAMKTFRVLFVDNPENIEQLKTACKDVGYVVAGATNLKDAWAFLDGKDHADVIVCAAHLEQESMFAFLKAVRDNAQHRDSMFLILSLESGVIGVQLDNTTRRAGMALGADSYVVMPTFDPVALVVAIKKLQATVPKLQQSGSPEDKARSQ